MRQIDINKKMSQEQIDHHASMIFKGDKKRRPCIRGCGKVFLSKDVGHRVCDVCARGENHGVLAESVFI